MCVYVRKYAQVCVCTCQGMLVWACACIPARGVQKVVCAHWRGFAYVCVFVVYFCVCVRMHVVFCVYACLHLCVCAPASTCECVYAPARVSRGLCECCLCAFGRAGEDEALPVCCML